MTMKLGTRGSDLALTQANWVAGRLEAAGESVEIVVISTAGDRSKAPSFGSIGPQGVFVKEIEESLARGDVDLAVHSLKDLPTHSPDGLVLAAVPGRVDPADYLLVHESAFDELAPGPLPVAAGSTIGTSSARRQRWLRHLREDVAVAPLRGNVPTRIGRVRNHDYDAIVLAYAGIERLDAYLEGFGAVLAGLRLVRLDPAVFVPAPAQGALGLQCRADDARTRRLLEALDEADAHAAVNAERTLLARAEGGCDAAFGACCRATHDGGFELTAMAEIDGSVHQASTTGADAGALIDPVWAALTASRSPAA